MAAVYADAAQSAAFKCGINTDLRDGIGEIPRQDRTLFVARNRCSISQSAPRASQNASMTAKVTVKTSTTSCGVDVVWHTRAARDSKATAPAGSSSS
jgi:hypothetical protein